jgi:hypothetical protein
MSKITEITCTFVDSAPERLRPGTMYISTKYRAIVHLCLCGCLEKVVLNLDSDSNSWSFTYDGRSISIAPSVGNIGLPCRSHYIVRRNRVRWLPRLLDVEPTVALGLGRHYEECREVSMPKWLPRWFLRRRRHSGMS